MLESTSFGLMGKRKAVCVLSTLLSVGEIAYLTET